MSEIGAGGCDTSTVWPVLPTRDPPRELVMPRDFDPTDLNGLRPATGAPGLPPLTAELHEIGDPRRFARRALAERLGEESAWYLAATLAEVPLEPGEPLFTYGEPGGGLYLLCAGTLRVSLPIVSPPLRLALVGPGSWLGEVHLIDGGAASATVVAESRALLLGLDAAGFMRVRQDDPGVASDILRAVLQDLAARVERSSRGLVRVDRDGALGLAPAAPDPVEILAERWKEIA